MNDLARRYHALAAYFRSRYGHRVHKVPLDAGFSCPNRDGTLSRRGCVFCNERGSGTGLALEGRDLAAQWGILTQRIERRYGHVGFMAYLQAFSNTHGPLEKLALALGRITGHPPPKHGSGGPLPGLLGLAVGTRPDCLDADKLTLLAAQPVREVWLELGLQSAHDATLERINRGHDFAAFEHAVRQASGLRAPGGPEEGLRICVHVMAGLPGESGELFLDTVARVAALPVHGIKFHNCYVCRGAALATTWRQGRYEPLAQDRYVEQVARALTLLQPGVVVQRLVADPAPGELLAPDWAGDKAATLRLLADYMADKELWQSKSLPGHESCPPLQFLPDGGATL